MLGPGGLEFIALSNKQQSQLLSPSRALGSCAKKAWLQDFLSTPVAGGTSLSL